MYQMPNIWHTKHKNEALSDVLNVSNFCNIEQYRCNFDMVQMRMAFAFIIFLFDFSLSSHYFNWFFLFPQNLSLSPNRCSFLFRSNSQLLPQPQTSFSLFAPQIKPKNLLSSLFIEQQSYGLGCDWLRQ